MGRGQYLVLVYLAPSHQNLKKSSTFEDCTLVFQVLGNHARIPCIFHCILMALQQRMRYIPTLSNAGQSFIFFTELSPPVAQSPLSPTTVTTTTITTTTTDESFILTSSTVSFWGMSHASFSHLPLSVFEGCLTLHFHIFHCQFLRDVSHESFIFTSSTVSFWGMSRTKASFSHLLLSVLEGCLARKLRLHIFRFQVQQLIQETSEPVWTLPCLALACDSSWTSNMRQEKHFFSEQWASA